MHKFTAIVPQMACDTQFLLMRMRNTSFAKNFNLTKKYKVLKGYMIRKIVKQEIIWFSNMQIRYFKDLCEPCLDVRELYYSFPVHCG